MQARKANETSVHVMKHNITKMNNKELIQAGYYYMDYFRITRDTEGKEILNLIEAEQNKRGIY